MNGVTLHGAMLLRLISVNLTLSMLIFSRSLAGSLSMSMKRGMIFSNLYLELMMCGKEECMKVGNYTSQLLKKNLSCQLLINLAQKQEN